MRTLWLIAKAVFFLIVGLVCTVMVGYALVDLYVSLSTVIWVNNWR